MVQKRYYNREIETMSREDFLEYQWQQLQRQVRYTYENSGLCQRQFKAAKITPDDIKTMEDFTNKVPFTTKEDLLADQEENPPYGTRLAVPEGEIFATYLTSGTSGKGQEVHAGTREDWGAYFNSMIMMYTWSGWKKDDRVMNPIPYSVTPGGFGHTMSMNRLGCDTFNLGTYDTKTKLEYIERFKLTAIFVTPAYLETLTAEADDMGLDLVRDLAVRKILIAIQAYPVSFIHRMEEKWQAKIFDYYGSTQLALAATCENGAAIGEQRGYYHMIAPTLHEVIDPETGRPVGSGEIGEVVVTPFNKKASSFLRFKSADRVRYFTHDACDCDRPFDLMEAGTISRYDDMMKIKGTNIWPETIDEIVLTKDETSEYQGRIYMSDERKEKADIVIEFKTGVTQDVKQRLIVKISNEVRDATGIGFIVRETTEALPHAVFKVRRWTDDRSKGLEK